MIRRISKFERSSLVSAAEADRHYEDKHYPMMQGLYSANPRIRRYYTNLAVVERHPDGTQSDVEPVWRFVVVELDDDGGLGSTWMPPQDRAAIFDDHAKFLRNLVGFEVQPVNTVDRMAGQTALTKYLIEHQVDPVGSFEVAVETYRQQVLPVLTAEGVRSEGVRLFTSNRVVHEFESAPINEPAQMFTGEFVQSPSTVAFDELYFDADAFAEGFLGRPDVQRALSTEGLRARVLAVVETCGVDKRQPAGP